MQKVVSQESVNDGTQQELVDHWLEMGRNAKQQRAESIIFKEQYLRLSTNKSSVYAASSASTA